MPDELLERLRRFQADCFPQYQEQFKALVLQGQRPSTLFIGCSDSRLMPYLLTGSGPGELFLVRNVGALVPPYSGLHGLHGTAAAIEFAMLKLQVRNIVVCGHSHCGAVKALYEDTPAEAKNLIAWLDMAREATLPVQPSAEALRRTEERSVVLQLERLMGYPMVRERVLRREVALHGWHYVIEEGQVCIFDIKSGKFVPALEAGRSEMHDGSEPIFNELDETWGGGR